VDLNYNIQLRNSNVNQSIENKLEDLRYFLDKNLMKMSLISRLPINGLVFEEILHNSFLKIGLESNWVPNSHKPGADITVKNFINDMDPISVKGGLLKNNYIQISSHRLTKHSTLLDKLNFINNCSNTYNYYVFNVRDYNKEKEEIRKYRTFLVPSNFIDLSNFVWFETDKCWKTRERVEDRTYLRINKNMSHQYWMYIDYEAFLNNSNIEQIGGITLPISMLGIEG